MKAVTVLATTTFLTLGAIGGAQAQSGSLQGTPESLFPDAAPNEVQIYNGVPCRTVLEHGTNRRIPVQCASPMGPIGVGMAPEITGSVPQGGSAVPAAAAVGSPFTDATPDEIMFVNGVPCRSEYVDGANQRVPVECGR